MNNSQCPVCGHIFTSIPKRRSALPKRFVMLTLILISLVYGLHYYLTPERVDQVSREIGSFLSILRK